LLLLLPPLPPLLWLLRFRIAMGYAVLRILYTETYAIIGAGF
jgi:hypothetical protein